MKEKNKTGYFISNKNIIYVQGSTSDGFKRYSTGKLATKLNVLWIKKNCSDVLLQIYNDKQEINSKPKSDNFIDFALDSLKLNCTERKESTNEEYKSIFNKYIKNDFKNYQLEDIKKSDLLRWQNKLLKLDISVGRVRFIRAVFSGILTDAFQNQLIKENPFRFIKQPKNETEDNNINPFSLIEINSILSASIGQWKNIFTILFFTGIRTGECWGLKWEDINFINKTISIKRSIRHGKVGTPKTKNSIRTIDMIPIVEKALRNQKSHTIARDSFVFMNKNKEHFKSAQHISRDIWKPILKIAGLDFRILYQTRHTFASLMISQGEDIVWVSKMLGHSSPRITLDIYTKYIPEIKKERASFLNEFKEKNCNKTANTKFRILRSS